MKNGLTYSTPEYTQRWKLPLKWRFCFQLFLFTGDRRGENPALTWEDLDFEKCTIHIDKASARADGETFQKSTKTYKRRTVVVPGFVMDVARLYLAEQKRQCLNMGDRWEGYRGGDFKKNFLFIQQNGQQMDLGSPRQQFKRLIRIFNQNVLQPKKKNFQKQLPYMILDTYMSSTRQNNFQEISALFSAPLSVHSHIPSAQKSFIFQTMST